MFADISHRRCSVSPFFILAHGGTNSCTAVFRRWLIHSFKPVGSRSCIAIKSFHQYFFFCLPALLLFVCFHPCVVSPYMLFFLLHGSIQTSRTVSLGETEDSTLPHIKVIVSKWPAWMFHRSGSQRWSNFSFLHDLKSQKPFLMKNSIEKFSLNLILMQDASLLEQCNLEMVSWKGMYGITSHSNDESTDCVLLYSTCWTASLKQAVFSLFHFQKCIKGLTVVLPAVKNWKAVWHHGLRVRMTIKSLKISKKVSMLLECKSL